MPKAKFWQTHEFKLLQKLWEEELKKSGFIDAERNGRLIQNAANSYRTQVQTVIENKRRYYELLGQNHHREDFSDPVEKYVMERRANGISIKQISLELKSAGTKLSRGVSTETLRQIIRFYEKKWKIRKKKTL